MPGNDATVTFGYDGRQLKEGLERDGRRIKTFSTKAEQAFSHLKGVAAGIGLGLLARQGTQAVTSMDRLRRGMANLEGGTEQANKRLDELRVLSRLPGVDFEQAVMADIKLRTVGLSAEHSASAIVEFGNALSAAGGSSTDMEGVILALTQIMSLGKVSAEEINQIAGRVPQIRQVMSKVFGTADTEQLQKMKLTAEEFVTGLIGGFSDLKRAAAGYDEKLQGFTTSTKLAEEAFMSGLVGHGVEGAASLGDALEENIETIRDVGQAAASTGKLVFDLGKGTVDKLSYITAFLGLVIQDGMSASEAAVALLDSTEAAAAAEKAVLEDKEKEKKKTAKEDVRRWDATQKAGEEQIKLEERVKEARAAAAFDLMSPMQQLAELRKRDTSLKIEGDTQDPIRRLEIELKRIAIQRDINQLISTEKRHRGEVIAAAAQQSVQAFKRLEAERQIVREQGKARDAARNDVLADLKALQLRAAGRDKAADKLERELRLQAEIERLRQLGASPAQAASLAQDRLNAEEDLTRRQNGQGRKIRHTGRVIDSFTGLNGFNALQKDPGMTHGLTGPTQPLTGTFRPLSGRSLADYYGPGGSTSTTSSSGAAATRSPTTAATANGIGKAAPITVEGMEKLNSLLSRVLTGS